MGARSLIGLRWVISNVAHLAQSFYLILNIMNKEMIWFIFKDANTINTYNCSGFDLTNKKICNDRRQKKSDQCLRLFSSRRKPPLLVTEVFLCLLSLLHLQRLDPPSVPQLIGVSNNTWLLEDEDSAVVSCHLDDIGMNTILYRAPSNVWKNHVMSSQVMSVRRPVVCSIVHAFIRELT